MQNNDTFVQKKSFWPGVGNGCVPYAVRTAVEMMRQKMTFTPPASAPVSTTGISRRVAFVHLLITINDAGQEVEYYNMLPEGVKIVSVTPNA